MRTAALVLGIVGGVFGIIAGLLALAIGGVAAGLDAEGGGTAAVGGFIAVLLGVGGIVGGALAHRSPRASWILLLIAGLGGFIAISAFWILSGLLFVVGAILEFSARREPTAVGASAPQ